LRQLGLAVLLAAAVIALAVGRVGSHRPPTVGALLAARGIALAPGDDVVPSVDRPVGRSTRVRVRLRQLVAVPPPVTRLPNPLAARGDIRVLHPGHPGYALATRALLLTVDAPPRAAGRTRTPLQRPAPALVLAGTAVPHELVVGGIRYRYVAELTMVATAYNGSYRANGPWGPYAALGGRPLTRGMAAVDPSVIPLGTRLYVEGYGPALAADTGSAIQGDRIDLFLPASNAETARFGIRTVKVYVLG
jgi:3D (Asp-Asp-Asp) domain-containing protein